MAGMPTHRPGNGGTQDALLDPRAILTSIGVVVYNWNLTSDRIEWGRNAAEVLGLGDMAGWSSGQEFGALVEPDAGPTILETIQGAKDRDTGSGVPYSLDYVIRPKPDRAIAVEDSGRWYADANGKPAFAHGMVRVRRAGADAAGAAGSRERSHLLARIAGEVVETARSKNTLTIVVAALDNLPALNDEIGFEAADAVIEEVFRRLRGTMRRRDRFARYSGNRFALALRSCPPDQITIAVDRLIQAVSSEPIATPKGPVTARLAFGAATAPQHATESSALLRCAEQSLVGAKRHGARAPLVLYDPKTMRGERRRSPISRSADVLGLLNERRITIACQPVVEAASRQVAFSEALLRVEGQDGRIAIAAHIIPAVEQIGLVPLVDIRVLEIVAAHLAGHPDERLSMNVSPLTLESSDWLPALSANLGAHPGIAERLIVEITETVAIQDPDATAKRLDAMKALGIALAIDDFGAGHTSFKHLRNFPIDLIKIDGAFAQNLAGSNDARFFVRTLIDLAHHLCITAVAEWVEDEETATLLAGWGVDYLQGDHCGRPALIRRPDRKPMILRA